MEWKELRAALRGELRAALRGLTIYQEALETEIGQTVTGLLDALYRQDGEGALAAYTGLFSALCRAEFQGLGDWLWDRLRCHESAYSLLIDRGGSAPALEQAARRDVDTLAQLAGTGCSCFLDAIQPLLPPEFAPVLAGLPQWRTEAPFDFDTLTAFYREHGAGLYAKYRAFLWEDGSLIPVADPDCPHPVELLGYEQQRQQVLDNTRLLVAGRPSNNVLLFGDGGTGKSATVKSMLYLEGMEDLRLIEVQKENLVGMPRLIRSLAGRRQKFILFIDDLAFDQDDQTYSSLQTILEGGLEKRPVNVAIYATSNRRHDQDDQTYSSLKTILEGGLEKRPVNVAIYATSNRRHLVRQTFSERAGEEIDTFETISEKTALAERFGLRIPYMTMNKRDYLALIDHLAGLYQVEMDRELLHARAMEWEIRHAGRTPRVARQFIASLTG